MRLNKKGAELYNIWYENYCKENDNIGGNSAEHDFVEGWSIIDNKDYIRTITDECGLLLFAYGEYVFDVLDEWAVDCDETEKVCGGYTIAEVKQEILNYVDII